MNDLVGIRFGNLVVKEFAGLNGQKRRMWLCKCDCGSSKQVRADALTGGRATTCGCRNLDLTEQRFGKLVVKEQIGSTKHKRRMWLCQCDCGNTTEVPSNYLVNGETRSCGCFKASGDGRVTHGYRRHQTSKKQNKVYTAWCNMKHRCYYQADPNYSSYGARGITVCDRWKNGFENFLTDVGEPQRSDLTLERLDPNGNYEPGNVVWATELIQRLNKQDTQREFIDLKETLRELCLRANVPFEKLFERFLVGDRMVSLLEQEIIPE